jgi:phosphoribosylpyrophosphate synthetase
MWCSPSERIPVLPAIPYWPKRRDGGPTTQFVLNVKERDHISVFVAAALLAIKAHRLGRKIAQQSGRWILAAIPPSTGGTANAACEKICAILARRFPERFEHYPGLLCRETSVPKSSTSYLRPTIDDHYHTIALTDWAAVRGRCVALVDDVYTRGAHTDACARHLRAAGAKAIVALPLSRTVS